MRSKTNFDTCEAVLESMSSFIDSMSTSEETERLQSHLSQCPPCGRQLQALISLRNLVAGVESTAVPEDLALETRVKLSRARARNYRDRWQARLDNVLKPFAVPAVSGITLTLLGFAMLLSSLAAPRVAQAQNQQEIGPMVKTYEPLETTIPTMKRFGSTISPELEQLSIKAEVSTIGRAYDYTIIAGTRSPGIDRWIQETLLLAQFRPATSWGNPVNSSVILSFVNVRG